MTRLRPLTALLVLATALVGCAPPPPGVHEWLRIGADGSYRLQEVPVPADQLGAALTAQQQREPGLFIQIVASPDAPIEASTRAVGWLKERGIRFAFVDEAVMRPPRAAH